MAFLLRESRTAGNVQSGDSAYQWDRDVAELGGQVHQSWKWGEFRRSQGWHVERCRVEQGVGRGLAQVLIRKHGPVSTAFIARGPLVSGDAHEIFPLLWTRILDACRRARVVNITVDPLCPVAAPPMIAPASISEATTQFSPERSVVVALDDDETIVRRMHSSKRREIRKADRAGIVIEDHGPDASGYEAFYVLMQETSVRNRIRIEDEGYYAQFLRSFGDDATLKLAIANGRVAAGLIAGRVGEEATYLYGGSSTEHRVPGATALLQLSAMQWARSLGCRRYDLWGIPAKDPVSYVGPDNKPIRSVGDDDTGLYRFKVGFGGDIVSYPASFEIRTRPHLWRTVTHLKGLRRAVRT